MLDQTRWTAKKTVPRGMIPPVRLCFFHRAFYAPDLRRNHRLHPARARFAPPETPPAARFANAPQSPPSCTTPSLSPWVEAGGRQHEIRAGVEAACRCGISTRGVGRHGSSAHHAAAGDAPLGRSGAGSCGHDAPRLRTGRRPSLRLPDSSQPFLRGVLSDPFFCSSAQGKGDWSITSVLHDTITIHRGNHGIPPSLPRCAD